MFGFFFFLIKMFKRDLYLCECFAHMYVCIPCICLILLFCFVSRDRVSWCSPGCPETCSLDQAGIELTEIPLPPQVVGLKPCATPAQRRHVFVIPILGVGRTGDPSSQLTLSGPPRSRKEHWRLTFGLQTSRDVHVWTQGCAYVACQKAGYINKDCLPIVF